MNEDTVDLVHKNTVRNEDTVDLVDKGVKKTSRRKVGPFRSKGGPPKMRATLETPQKCSKKVKIRKSEAAKNSPSILSYFEKTISRNPKKMSEQVEKIELENLRCVTSSLMMEKNAKNTEIAKNAKNDVVSIKKFFLTRLEDQKVEETKADNILPTLVESVSCGLGLVSQTNHQINLTAIKIKPKPN